MEPDPDPEVPDPDPEAAWWFDGARPAPALGTWPPPDLTLTEVSAATQPTAIAAPRGDASRLYFAEKWGVIRLIKDGALVNEPALDLRDAVLEGGPQGSTGPEMQNQGKRGLVGLAIHPNFEENGRIFVMYTADQGIAGYGTDDYTNLYDDGDMTIAEYRRSADNPDTFDAEPVSVILQFDKGNCNQCSQHNGGSLEIDVDGFLWASTGDPPPYDNPGSQDLNNLNGKLLRFDISGEEVTAAGNYPGADPYVASIGIRNAYKFSIDRFTGDMYVADVGENSWEEVTVEMYGDGNKDHGWPMLEGFQSYTALSCDKANCLDPIFDYGHSGAEGTPGADNCIIGGYVYRGAAIPALQGAYIYSDFGSGKVRALQVENGELLNGPHEFGGLSVFAGCFGEDAAGEVYVCDYEGNRILRVDAQ
jgi:glucose/arabinose dehydrogenase